MSNIYWPSRPDLCNKGDRDCRKLEDHEFRVLDEQGVDRGFIRITGDYAIVLHDIRITLVEVDRTP
jgi:hypothetical protein